LREPAVRFPIAAHMAFSCLLRQRGFFAECSHNGLSGDRDCGSRLACLAEDEQDAGLSRHDIEQDSRRPDAGSQPEPGRAASVAAPAGPRAAPMRFSLGGRVRAGIRRRVVWSLALCRAWKGPRPVRPPPDTPDGYRNRDPRKDHYENIRQRNPSAATNRRKAMWARFGNRTAGSRKHAVAPAHLSSALPVTAEGRLVM